MWFIGMCGDCVAIFCWLFGCGNAILWGMVLCSHVVVWFTDLEFKNHFGKDPHLTNHLILELLVWNSSEFKEIWWLNPLVGFPPQEWGMHFRLARVWWTFEHSFLFLCCHFVCWSSMKMVEMIRFWGIPLVWIQRVHTQLFGYRYSKTLQRFFQYTPDFFSFHCTVYVIGSLILCVATWGQSPWRSPQMVNPGSVAWCWSLWPKTPPKIEKTATKKNANKSTTLATS